MNLRKRVYERTKTIPRGYVTTYKELAHAVNTRAYRAVASALKNNPDVPATPCHRVIKSMREVGGYLGVKDSAKKRALLQEEGVRFQEDGRVHPKSMHYF